MQTGRGQRELFQLGERLRRGRGRRPQRADHVVVGLVGENRLAQRGQQVYRGGCRSGATLAVSQSI